MGSDLVSACIFCAGLLLGHDLAPRTGFSAETAFSYATLARRYDVTENRIDGSDVTPKFLLIGLGEAWAANGPRDLASYPGLAGRHPMVIAGVLYRDHGRRTDDASIVVLREAA